MGRDIILQAASSPTIVSLTGSQRIGRPTRAQMSQRWLTRSDRTELSILPTGSRRERMQSCQLSMMGLHVRAAGIVAIGQMDFLRADHRIEHRRRLG